MTRTVWKTINVYAGTLVIGTPAMLALAAAVTLRGIDVIWAAIPLVLTVWPLALWLWYLNTHPGRAARRLWLVAAVVLAIGTMISPWWFWSGPLLIVLASEIIRVATNPSSRRGVADTTYEKVVLRR